MSNFKERFKYIYSHDSKNFIKFFIYLFQDAIMELKEAEIFEKIYKGNKLHNKVNNLLNSFMNSNISYKSPHFIVKKTFNYVSTRKLIKISTSHFF